MKVKIRRKEESGRREWELREWNADREGDEPLRAGTCWGQADSGGGGVKEKLSLKIPGIGFYVHKRLSTLENIQKLICSKR